MKASARSVAACVAALPALATVSAQAQQSQGQQDPGQASDTTADSQSDSQAAPDGGVIAPPVEGHSGFRRGRRVTLEEM
jgi:hypothetical protein